MFVEIAPVAREFGGVCFFTNRTLELSLGAADVSRLVLGPNNTCCFPVQGVSVPRYASRFLFFFFFFFRRTVKNIMG